MSFNGSGTFVINSSGQPVVANTVISTTVFNALTADLATGLSTCITKDGQTTPTANIPMGTFKFTNLGVGSAATDSATLGQVQASTTKLVTVTGTDTITGTLSPALTAYTAGQMFYFVAGGANTGAVTLNIDGLGARNMTRHGSIALVAGDILSGEVCVVVYDGTRFQLLNPASYTNLNVTGVLALADGAVGTPSLTNTGDENTGLWFPAADTLAASTGGVERLRVDSSGNLGIGTASPVGRVDSVSNASSAFTARASTTGANQTATVLNVYNSDASLFALAKYNAVQHIWGYSGATEGMRLDSSGNLGIGVTPSAWSGVGGVLEIKGNAYIYSATGVLSSGANAFFNGTNWIYKTTQAATRYEQVNGLHQWSNAASGTAGNNISFTQAMTLDASGNLGIGTASPSRKLEVHGTPSTIGGTATGMLVSVVNNNTAFNASPTSGISLWNRFNSGGSTFPSAAIQAGKENATDGNYAGYLSFFTVDSVAGVNEGMRLDSSGRLGIGTTTNALTNVLTAYRSGSTQAAMAAGNSNTGLNGTLFGVDTAGNGIVNQTQVLPLILSTSNTERARITSGGELLVGTTSTTPNPGVGIFPSGFLSVGNNAGSSGFVFQYFVRSATTIGTISQNGTTAVLYNTTSDARLKENITPAPEAGEKIDAIQIVSHDWKSAPDERVEYGVIAQDLHGIAPQAVNAGDNGEEVERAWGVDYSKLVPMLVKEVQSLRKRVAELESK